MLIYVQRFPEGCCQPPVPAPAPRKKDNCGLKAFLFIFLFTFFSMNIYYFYLERNKISGFKGSERFESRAGARFLRVVLFNKKERNKNEAKGALTCTSNWNKNIPLERGEALFFAEPLKLVLSNILRTEWKPQNTISWIGGPSICWVISS